MTMIVCIVVDNDLTSLWDTGSGDDYDDNDEKHTDVIIIDLSSDCFRGVADDDCPGSNVQTAESGENFGRLRDNFGERHVVVGGTRGHFGELMSEGGGVKERRIVQSGEEERRIQPNDSLTLDNQNCSVDTANDHIKLHNMIKMSNQNMSIGAH